MDPMYSDHLRDGVTRAALWSRLGLWEGRRRSLGTNGWLISPQHQSALLLPSWATSRGTTTEGLNRPLLLSIWTSGSTVSDIVILFQARAYKDSAWDFDGECWSDPCCSSAVWFVPCPIWPEGVPHAVGCGACILRGGFKRDSVMLYMSGSSNALSLK